MRIGIRGLGVAAFILCAVGDANAAPMPIIEYLFNTSSGTNNSCDTEYGKPPAVPI